MSAPVKPNSLAPSDAPTFDALGYAMGCDDAREWLECHADGARTSASSAAWRAQRHAEEVGFLDGAKNFGQLMWAWEQGFDATLSKELRRFEFVLTNDEARIIRASRLLKSIENDDIVRFVEASAMDPRARRNGAPCPRIVGGGAA